MITSSADVRRQFVARFRRCAQSFVFHSKAFQYFLDSRPHYLLSRQEVVDKFKQLESEYLYLKSVVESSDSYVLNAPYISDDDDE